MSGPTSGATARARSPHDPDPRDRAPELPAAQATREGPQSGETVDRLYRQEAGWLRAALRRRLGRDDADDLTQEAFSRLQAVDAPIDHPRALLWTIATNAARQVFRKNQVRAPESGLSVELSETAAVEVGGPENAVLLSQLICALPTKLQDVFVLSRFEGLTYPEIAQRLGISVKTVEWRMAKALAICAARLRD